MLSQNFLPTMPALCQHNAGTYYAQNYAGMIASGLFMIGYYS